MCKTYIADIKSNASMVNRSTAHAQHELLLLVQVDFAHHAYQTDAQELVRKHTSLIVPRWHAVLVT